MDIGLRQVTIIGFEKRFPLVSEALKKNLETTFASSLNAANSKPEKYKFDIAIDYYPENEEGRPIGEPITTADGRIFYETRSLLIIGNYPGMFGDTKTALLVLNLMKPDLGLPEEEIKDIVPLFEQLKSYPLNLTPREIQV